MYTPWKWMEHVGFLTTCSQQKEINETYSHGNLPLILILHFTINLCKWCSLHLRNLLNLNLGCQLTATQWFIKCFLTVNYVGIYCFYLLMIYLTMLLICQNVASNRWMVNKLWIGKNLEVSGRGLIWETLLAFVWRNWGKPQKVLMDTADLQAEILTRTFQTQNLNAIHSNTTSIYTCYITFDIVSLFFRRYRKYLYFPSISLHLVLNTPNSPSKNLHSNFLTELHRD
jgi:hypothetical protein